MRTVTYSNGTHKLEQVDGRNFKLDGDSVLILQDDKKPILSGQVNLASEDVWLVFEHFRPSQVRDRFLKHLRVNGKPAKLDKNIRLAPYENGTIAIPHGRWYRPLEVYRETRWQGEPRKLLYYQYYKEKELGDINDQIASFVLKKGYMVTLAENQDGTGASKVYIARDRDLKVSRLPRSLHGKVSFVRVFPWRWTSKKGFGGGSDAAVKLGASWRYDWGASGQSTLDMEYVPMRHNAHWDSFDKINRLHGATHLLGFNEPMQKDQANMSMKQVLDMWPKLQESGLRLGSPAPTDGALDWLYEFIDEADRRGLRVDFVAVHYYRGGKSDEQVYEWLKAVHERTGRPLWVTEFNNGAPWVKNHNPTQQQNAAHLVGYCRVMERCDFVERYAVFNCPANRRVINKGKLTPSGEAYRKINSAEAYTPR